MSILMEEFFVFPEQIYRIGNSTSHRLPNIRPDEIDIIEIDAVKVVIANDKGISLWTAEGIIKKGLTGYAWKFEKGTSVISGLKLISDEPGHYMLSPLYNIPLDKYRGLLEEMGLLCGKYFHIRKPGELTRLR